jgi:hypothetical protein
MTYSATQLQLTHVLQRFYRRVGGKVTLATGGTTTTVIDTKLADELGDGNEDDFYNGGTVIVIEDAGGSNAAPEGEFSRITDYEASTTTATFSPALTVAPASGDRVLLASPDFPLYDMIEVVNDALEYLGNIPLVDTSITVAGGTVDYTLPIAVKGRRIVDVVQKDGVDYYPVSNWKIIPATAGSTETLNIPQLTEGDTLYIHYLGKHPRVDAYDAPISEYFDPDLVHAAVFAHAIQWKNDNGLLTGGVDSAYQAIEQKAWSQLDREILRHPVQLPKGRNQGMPMWLERHDKTGYS